MHVHVNIMRVGGKLRNYKRGRMSHYNCLVEINANRNKYETSIVSLNFIWTSYINIAFQLKSVENCVNVRAQLQSLFKIVKPDCLSFLFSVIPFDITLAILGCIEINPHEDKSLCRY